jgi:hypothetical protein
LNWGENELLELEKKVHGEEEKIELPMTMFHLHITDHV